MTKSQRRSLLGAVEWASLESLLPMVCASRQAIVFMSRNGMLERPGQWSGYLTEQGVEFFRKAESLW